MRPQLVLVLLQLGIQSVLCQTPTNETGSELQNLVEEVAYLKKGIDELKTEIHTLMELNSDKLDQTREDLEMLKNSSDELAHTVISSMEMASTEVDGTNPCTKAERKDPSSQSGFYWTHNAIGHPVPVYCKMNHSCCGGVGAWLRIAHIDMNDPSHHCPQGFSKGSGSQCYYSSSGCRSITFPLHGIEYTRVCGKIVGYQYGQPDAFHGGTGTIDQGYVDGISITHRTSCSGRKHIWTFAAAQDEMYADSSRCPCSRTDRLFTGRIPDFVGDDYFCDSGSRTTANGNEFYGGDPLWDGRGCGDKSACCRFNNPPWFCKQLSDSTSDNIELRVCEDTSYIYRYGYSERVYFELIELYVK